MTQKKQLNEGQQKSLALLIEFIREPKTGAMFLLEGYAGTGKTFLMGEFFNYVKKNFRYWQIAATAPTNKAVKELKKRGNNSNRIEFATIHKLLGLKEEITAEGKQIFTTDSFQPVNIDGFNVLVVDEVSMLNDELFVEVQRHARSLKIIFVGDPAQIPPVNKVDCIPFTKEGQDKYDIRVALLTEIMRQKNGNPIIEASFEIRQNLVLSNLCISEDTNINDQGNGMICINPTYKEDELRVLLEKHFTSPEFKEDPDFCKVIAWRNRTIDKMNVMIRKMLYGDSEIKKIMIGEKLLANKPITFQSGPVKIILFTTNEEFEVVSYRIDAKKSGLKYYDMVVKWTSITGENREIKNVCVLHEDSEVEFNAKVEAMRKHAIGIKDHWLRKTAWTDYYNFARQFADVGYNYSISAHKSQGSSYRNVFILEDDININKNVVERNRIKYTAMTRAVDKIYIVKR